jgi:hypothetical protein
MNELGTTISCIKTTRPSVFSSTGAICFIEDERLAGNLLRFSAPII